MKTKVMFERRQREKKLLYDNSAYEDSKELINQFNEMKKIAANLSFKNKGILQNMSLEILVDIIDEMRRDRKIKMSISDASSVYQYIMLDLNDPMPVEERPPILHKAIVAKQVSRQLLTQQLSIIKMNFIFECIKKVNS
jgi:hypothetical protein